MGRKRYECLFVGHIPLKVETMELQAQVSFAANIHLQVYMLKIRLHCPNGNPHMKCNLVIFISQTS